MGLEKIEGIFGKLNQRLRETHLDEVAEVLLSGTPAGAAFSIVRGIGRILGKDTQDPDEVADMLAEGVTPEQRAAILDMKAREIEATEETTRAEMDAVTRRWEADMMSDSWLSKNIRPLTLAVSLAAALLYAAVALVAVLVLKTDMTEYQVDLLAKLGASLFSLVTFFGGAYVLGRSVEKSVILPSANSGSWLERVAERFRNMKGAR